MCADIDPFGRQISSLIENLSITFCVKIETVDVLRKTVMIYGAGGKTPVHRMNFDFPVRDDKPFLRGQVHD